MSHKRTILFLASNPKRLSEVRSTREYTAIKKIFTQGDLKDAYHLEPEFNVTADKFLSSLRTLKPWLVHFCGHGVEEKGIILEKGKKGKNILDSRKLIQHISDCVSIKGVFLNSCHSATLADDFVEVVDFFIGVENKIKDSKAIKFSETFYKIFEEYECIWFAMKHAERNFSTLKMKPFTPVLRWNKFKTMVQAQNDLINHLSLKIKDLSRLGDESVILTKDFEALLNDPSQRSNYRELLETHPFSQIPIWLDHERDFIASYLASQCLKGESERRIKSFRRSLLLIIDLLEIVVVNQSSKNLSKKLVRDALNKNFDVSSYIRALNILPKMPKNFSEESKAYLRDSCKYIRNIINNL